MLPLRITAEESLQEDERLLGSKVLPLAGVNGREEVFAAVVGRAREGVAIWVRGVGTVDVHFFALALYEDWIEDREPQRSSALQICVNKKCLFLV